VLDDTGNTSRGRAPDRVFGGPGRIHHYIIEFLEFGNFQYLRLDVNEICREWPTPAFKSSRPHQGVHYTHNFVVSNTMIVGGRNPNPLFPFTLDYLEIENMNGSLEKQLNILKPSSKPKRA